MRSNFAAEYKPMLFYRYFLKKFRGRINSPNRKSLFFWRVLCLINLIMLITLSILSYFTEIFVTFRFFLQKIRTFQRLVRCWSEIYLQTFNERKLVASASGVQGGTESQHFLRAFQFSEGLFEKVFTCLKLTNKYFLMK